MISGRTVRQDLVLRALPCCAAALAIAVCVWAASLGNSLKLDRDIGQEHELALETEQVCARLGAPRFTSAFADCAVELDAVRQRERERGFIEESGLP